MNQTLMSECFRAFFLTPQLRLDYTKLGADQVVQKLREPSSLTLTVYFQRFTRAEGFESAADFSIIHMNRKYTATWPVCSIASLGLHELSHTKGFFHMGNSPGPNYFSVPYQVNHAAESGCCIEPHGL